MTTQPEVSSSAPYRSERYNPQEIEPKWQARWAELKLYETDLESDQEPFYYLTMFPYPSGDLHIGHWYAFSIPDAYARFKRMRGLNVLFPMGFDAFGLPAENAAIKAARQGGSVHPATLTYERMAHMERQFAKMGASFDWSKKVVTCDPGYYRWNQLFFLRMLERGLAYRKASFVNWDPVDQTVLANEQVVNGRGERSGALVERRLMPQWHFKITAYAEELLDFSGLDWPEKVKLMQTNWIGRSEGAEVRFKTESGDELVVFTTRPDTLWGVTFMVLAPEHPLVEKLTTPEQREAVARYVKAASHLSEIERQATDKEKTGEFTGAFAINPVNGERVPIWIADYVMMGYGTGAVMAVPAHDERDFAFARAFGLPVKPVIAASEGAEVDGEAMTEAYTGDGVMVNSGPFDGTPTGKGTPEGIHKVIAWLEAKGKGKGTVTYRLRDWLISRQRYWGTPIPVLYCDRCGLVPEREENLPVLLPEDVAFMPTGESPLKHHAGFLNATCPSCGGPAQRETDTMDTFVDSSWYWFRYLSPDLQDAPIDRQRARRWTPVDQYTGGIEHAILHLLYARFFTKVLRDLGFVDVDEPFKRLRNQGMILGEDNEKMSKSRGNVVNPDDLVAEYGADTVRAYLMFIGPWEAGGPWSSTGIEGVARFLNRVWALLTEPVEATGGDPETRKALRRAVHHAIKEVTEDLEAFGFNTAVAELMTLTNAMSRAKPALAGTDVWEEATEALLLLLAPIAPHLADELWERSGRAGSVHQQVWPTPDEGALVQDTVTIAVQVSGKRRGEVTVPKGADDAAVLAAAKAEPNVARHLENAQVVREIVVPGRLVNIVVRK
ncbi:leucine--tRNA ligase [Truepera radiovictrix]|uniref:Leucine--tRNA ligase n=1 Tax=Truepera radiovictrix (strain DSM 17093 / CIP 108686 / LMG 22925 / RQ-24) TaxID=649638 RepID=D7CRE6_TRURR|nr:leucine--tRNA ligase [Truepera radiovictrix]ADI15234.1 leucyl-tRNA synthetase [Truepera radiovictrix DSM 17093]WMT56213.1 leucine--tRNA ligase [Truepera radiovictrix]